MKNKNNIILNINLSLILVIFNVLIIGALLFLMNYSTTQTNNVSQVISQLNDLNIKNQVLQEKIAQTQGIDKVKNEASKLGLVEAKNVQYINSSDIISYNTK